MLHVLVIIKYHCKLLLVITLTRWRLISVIKYQLDFDSLYML